MTYLLMGLLLSFIAWTPMQRVPASSLGTQTFQIIIKGEAAGTEVVTESTDKDGNILLRSDHEMLLSDGLEVKRVAFSTESVFEAKSLQPLYYKLQYSSGDSHDSCEVKASGKELTRVLTRGNRTSETKTQILAGTVLLEPNVYYLYEFLVRQYDTKKGGRQLFQAYLPPVGAEVPAALTQLENSSIDAPGGAVTVRNFRYEFVALSGGVLSVDERGKLVRLSNPAQELEVLRK